MRTNINTGVSLTGGVFITSLACVLSAVYYYSEKVALEAKLKTAEDDLKIVRELNRLLTNNVQKITDEFHQVHLNINAINTNMSNVNTKVSVLESKASMFGLFSSWSVLDFCVLGFTVTILGVVLYHSFSIAPFNFQVGINSANDLNRIVIEHVDNVSAVVLAHGDRLHDIAIEHADELHAALYHSLHYKLETIHLKNTLLTANLNADALATLNEVALAAANF